MFRFKQFTVDQTGCAMKINTDGVLLGSIAAADNPASILDIGTGTGVIALMLAQKYGDAVIDAVEIDATAAATAGRNFKNSAFSKRLTVHCSDINDFDKELERKYDLIVSNPPFYINSLESPKQRKTLAKHTESSFFEMLAKDVAGRLTEKGCCWLILSIEAATEVVPLIKQNGMSLSKTISICSYAHSAAHRVILCFGFDELPHQMSKFIIYEAKGVYSAENRKLLQPYFIAY